MHLNPKPLLAGCCLCLQPNSPAFCACVGKMLRALVKYAADPLAIVKQMVRASAVC